MPGDSAFTFVELLVVIFVIAILAALTLPCLNCGGLTKGKMTGTLNNERQLQLATQQMALDATTTGDTNIGWPGDLGDTTIQAWVSNLVPAYMQTNDILKLFQAPCVPQISDFTAISGSTIPYFVYPVRTSDSTNTIFIVTRNWAGFAKPLLDVEPYRQTGVVLFHTGGDGEIFYNKQTSTATNGGMLGETNGLPPLRSIAPMKKNPASQTHDRATAFTFIELLVVVAIIGVLAALMLPAFSNAIVKGQMTGTLNSECQLMLATQQMALDATKTEDHTIGWPGDVSNTTVQAWVRNLVPTYMQTNDLLKLFRAPGIAPIASISAISAGNIPFRVYGVQATNPGDTIFLVTRNWGGFTSPLLDISPYGKNGFVVMHMGDGEIFHDKQATNPCATNGGMLGETNGLPTLR